MMRAPASRHSNASRQSRFSALAGLATVLMTPLRRACLTLLCWSARSRQRRSLRELTAAQLKDVGLTAEQAKREAIKYFWQC